jgi:hypothetical protein
MTNNELLWWIITNLLTDSQLSVVPPGYTQALRYLKVE